MKMMSWLKGMMEHNKNILGFHSQYLEKTIFYNHTDLEIDLKNIVDIRLV